MRVFFDFEFIEGGAAFVMQPISVGMVREDGEEYYAEFKEVDWSMANSWVLSNVRPHLTGPLKRKLTITQEIMEFVGEKPEFWAYFADYDWVLLCQLFGRMIDLPEGWPMYCLDIKQLMWHHRLSKDNLKINTSDLVPHHALSDALWNKRAYNTIADGIRRSSIHFIRPGKDYGGNDLG